MSWSKEQWNNAAVIYQVGVKMGMSARDIQIALITALTESGMRNLNYGDRDSLGIFQQRPSSGWGTPQQVTNPVYASTKFFEALKGLGQKRYGMSMGEAAQAVQRSAFPDRYATHLSEVRANWPTVQSRAGDVPNTPDGVPVNQTTTTFDPQPLVYTPPTIEAPIDRGYLGPADTSSLGQAGGILGVADTSALAAPQMDASGAQMTVAQVPEAAPIIGPQTANHLNNLREQVVGTPFEKGVNGWRKAVIQTARQALGTPYVWGGTNLQSGVDCSGLVQAAFAKAGINLPRISFQQANSGQRVGEKGLRPGDLVAWDNSSRNSGADHISIYLGNGYIIEAPRPGLAVRIRKLGPNLEGGWGVHLDF